MTRVDGRATIQCMTRWRLRVMILVRGSLLAAATMVMLAGIWRLAESDGSGATLLLGACGAILAVEWAADRVIHRRWPR